MKSVAVAAVLASVLAFPVVADEQHHKKQAGAAPAAAQASTMAEGEIRKVDKDAKKITIKHGPLEKFEMPAMTMVFQVKEPAMLDQVKAGDKVRFEAEKSGGAFTITRIEQAR